MSQNAGTKTLAQKATLNRSADVLAESLAAAVQAGMTEKAAEIAAELSKLQIKCEIQVLPEENEIRSQHPEFTVKVHVEDRISDGCYISITVKSSDTIGDLKRRVMILHNFPMEVQRWIIGKKIYPDQTRLHQCGVKGAGHTLYLYLVTAHSVGLSKESYEAQLQAIMLMNQANAAPIKQIPSVSGALPSSLDSVLRDSGVHDTHKASTISSSGDSLEQTGVVPLTVGSGSYPSLSSSARIQEMLQTSPLSHLSGNFPGTPSTPAESVLNHASPALSADAWAFIPAATTSAPQTSTINTNSNSNNPAMVNATSTVTGPPVESEEMREGWSCPACTFRNLPMWPGCEICNQQRPEDYQIPENYQLTERELHLIHDEQVLERLTRELQRPDAGVPQQPKLWGNLELLQALEAQDRAVQQRPPVEQAVHADDSPDDVHKIFATNNSIIIRDVSDNQEDNDLRTLTQPHGGEDSLASILQSLRTVQRTIQSSKMRFNLDTDNLRAEDVVDGRAPHCRADDFLGDESSDEENTHA
ncbi:ranbp-type and c3hc4-type Zinc finger-containing protein 1 [Plakobranchus ocellatus]|uniref:Ranbp-type and c3hc4-type Zinc finger-containing protein 1 n=1 Tax=Plakobranchus ocellatus TaxID=259542 RepID=A0AAV4D389_9GAST|nr:ranbp-type and c3hc4-type Zinc finger-containing protein 1 [Plakobranchus ocellatus]